MAIDQSGAKTLSAQVKAELVQRIASGRYAIGERIPSLRSMSDEFEVAELTVHAAVKELQYEGVLESVSGRGTFVRAVPSGSPEVDLATQVATLQGEVDSLRDRVAALESERGRET